jgi:hypothetical protein
LCLASCPKCCILLSNKSARSGAQDGFYYLVIINSFLSVLVCVGRWSLSVIGWQIQIQLAGKYASDWLVNTQVIGW